MARQPRPWWWEEEAGWYVNLDGRRHFRGKHHAEAAKPKKSKKSGQWNAPHAIDQAFRNLLERGTTEPALGDGESVGNYLQAFPKWCKDNRSPKTTRRYF